MPDSRPHLLILGGTGEALALARAVVDAGRMQVTSSLAGRTRAPTPIPGAVRIGGFGGALGLRDWIDAQRIDAIIDATHPFAAQIFVWRDLPGQSNRETIGAGSRMRRRRRVWFQRWGAALF
jgi:hypothetical protein